MSSKVLFTLLALPTLIACGSAADFAGPTGTVAPVHVNLEWRMTCDEGVYLMAPVESSADVVAAGENKFLIQGGGDHMLKLNSESTVTLNLNGQFCTPKRLPRDIVFIIDVSGSMDLNDRLTNNSCGRLEALKQTLKNLEDQQGATQFAVVTFSTGIDGASSKFFTTRTALEQDIAKGGTIEDTICKHDDKTNYDIALTTAKDLLSKGRAQATKEIYFISDGEPDNDKDGLTIANSLKNQGVTIGSTKILVTIATIMLKGKDWILENYIASRDEDDKPMHARVENASDLAAVLAKLAFSEIEKGQLRYRPAGQQEWQTFDLKPPSEADQAFSLAPYDFVVSNAPNGLEVIFEYWTNHKVSHQVQGKLTWH